MNGSIVQTPGWSAALGLLCGIVGFRIGWRSGRRWALPAIQAAFGALAFVVAWSAAGPRVAALSVVAWAVGASIVSIPTFRAAPGATDRRVVRAARYRGEMYAWLATGRGPEAVPGKTVARHVVELCAYVAAAVVSINVLSLWMGAVLLNFMNAWVATLLRAARRPWTVRVLAWNVWSVVRVAAYVAIGAAGAWPLASRTTLAVPWSEVRPLAIAGAIGVVLDLVLKLALSRPCGRILARAVDLRAVADPGRGGAP